MKAYISGKISGEDFEQVIEKFDRACCKVEALGYRPVSPLNNGLTVNHSWEQHMLADIQMLFKCDAIFLIKDWVHSTGARIERKIAEEKGLKLLFEDSSAEYRYRINQIESAIFDVTGLHYEDYMVCSKKMYVYYPRMIFAHQTSNIKGISKKDVAFFINKSESWIPRILKIYDNEYNSTPSFREMADKVSIILNNNVSQ